MIHHTIQFSGEKSKEDEASMDFDRFILRLVQWFNRTQNSAKWRKDFRVARFNIATFNYDNNFNSGSGNNFHNNKENHNNQQYNEQNNDIQNHSGKLSHWEGLCYLSLWLD